MNENNTVLYIGGFELPDKNAAAQRVVGIAKGLRKLCYRIVFLNSLKRSKKDKENKEYYGFECYEYGREGNIDYFITAKTALMMIKKIRPAIVIAYNYPSVALRRINIFCKKKGIRCYADVTEWYHVTGGNIIHKTIKNLDSWYRMTRIHKQLDGVIAISRYLFNYYETAVKTVLIPPTVDITDSKWSRIEKSGSNCVSFIYAGSPSSTKEELDVIVEAISNVSKKKKLILEIVGITEEEYNNMYSYENINKDCIRFHGRVTHENTIEFVKKTDWAIIIRNNDSKVVRAGFPTKMVESISCGTPVIVNRFSNIEDYLNADNSIIIDEEKELEEAIINAKSKKQSIDREIFDYKYFLGELRDLFVGI